jgi:hypothetical protein
VLRCSTAGLAAACLGHHAGTESTSHERPVDDPDDPRASTTRFLREDAGAGQRNPPRIEATGCETVGSAHVGSNPTPATTCENTCWPADEVSGIYIADAGTIISPQDQGTLAEWTAAWRESTRA